MAFKISGVTQKLTRLEPINFGEGSDLNITYNPAVYTPKYLAEVAAQQGNQDVGAIVTMMENLIVAWDAMDDTGELVQGSSPETPLPIPLKAAYLEQMPIEFLTTVLEHVTQAMRPNPTRSENSGSFS